MTELTKIERHQRHYQICECLGDSDICCDPTCCGDTEAEKRIEERVFKMLDDKVAKQQERTYGASYSWAEALSKVTRFEVIDWSGRMYASWNVEVELQVQDEGRTLKAFIKKRKAE